MKYSVHLTDTTSEETRQAILAPLRTYNQSHTGPYESRGLTIELRDEHGSIIGGLWGASKFDWLFVQLLVVPEALRGQGIGRQLMSMAETEAAQRGCSAVWLDTFEFQARSFYERLGYTCFGQLENYPKGYARFFMQKAIGPSSARQQRKVRSGRRAAMALPTSSSPRPCPAAGRSPSSPPDTR